MSLQPGEFTMKDEMLHPYGDCCRWIQYVASKQAKYGTKIFALCAAKTFHCSNLEVYCGMHPKDNIGYLMLLRMRNLTSGSCYTSCLLSEYLLQKTIICIGTMMKNRRRNWKCNV
ncbi:uncharacterized protein LOC126184176 [Schistocerca cancellata]|uniref:uncharacterized protein LOC126184176 n=1 Tax=Schistocerca cancellata TaxID=274614 RepID=UPI002118439D|nr:uncharacterized protein LOC126184176 [Schistocerca cancellata]